VIQITPQMRLLVAVEPVDFRKGIDGLGALCRSALGSDPLAGALFIFRSRNRRALKLLMYDGQGFWLCQKRLSKGTFRWWPSATTTTTTEATLRLEAHQVQLLLWNGDPSSARTAPLWRALPG